MVPRGPALPMQVVERESGTPLGLVTRAGLNVCQTKPPARATILALNVLCSTSGAL